MHHFIEKLHCHFRANHCDVRCPLQHIFDQTAVVGFSVADDQVVDRGEIDQTAQLFQIGLAKFFVRSVYQSRLFAAN